MILVDHYGLLPSTANKKAIKSYTLAIPKAEFIRTKTLFSITRDWFVAAKERWQKNLIWHYHDSPSDVSIDVHFTALFSKEKDAVEVLFIQGWPRSLFEFLPLLKFLRERYTEDSLPYYIIVPSIPVYGFSDALTVTDASYILDHLMSKTLGVKSYISQGLFMSRYNGNNSSSCKGVLIHFSPVPKPEGATLDDMDEGDKIAMKRYERFVTGAVSYMGTHVTRPSTVGLAIMTNPIATDLASSPPTSHIGSRQSSNTTASPYSTELMNEAITRAALYYVTGCMGTSLDAASTVQRGLYIAKPKIFSCSSFPWEIMGAPKERIATSGDIGRPLCYDGTAKAYMGRRVGVFAIITDEFIMY
ncbi:Alpha/Beta hydrolase protein [Trichoderma austrokoningii]